MSENMTKKEEMFVRYYCSDAKFNGALAARMAGYAPKSSHVTAAQLLAKPKIQRGIELFMDELRKSTKLTAEKLVQELEEVRVAALSCETPQCSAAVSSIMGKAKLVGLDRDANQEEQKPTPVTVTLAVKDASK
jgi:phage terminase small subunit